MFLNPNAPKFQSKLSQSFTIMIKEHSVPTESYINDALELGYEFPHTIIQMPLPKHSYIINTNELGYIFPHTIKKIPLLQNTPHETRTDRT